jgi:hypothetical protein
VSSIDIEGSREKYGGETEEQTLRNIAKYWNCRRIYKYTHQYGEEHHTNYYKRKPHTNYKIVENPGDEYEKSLFRSVAEHGVFNVVLVYDDGKVIVPKDDNNQNTSSKSRWRFWK